MTETYISEAFDDCNSMPWDEASEFPTRALQEEALDISVSSIDGRISRDEASEFPTRALQEEALDISVSSIDGRISRDEANEFPARAWQEEVDVTVSSIDGRISGQWCPIGESRQKMMQATVEIGSIDDTVSDRWRRIGAARRKKILDEDRRRGGTAFDINTNCNVDRYFQVAHRALEQFHKMYQDGSELEETYIMGYRMVSFLTECLPRHPGYRRPSVNNLRKQKLWELDHLQVCLEALALKIDEEQCNKYAEDFDPLVHVDNSDSSDSEDEEVTAAASNGWVAFADSKNEKPQADSPTSTVTTSGTSSFEALDCYSSDDSMPERKIDFSDYEEDSHGRESLLDDLSTDFLEKVANEKVEYESDSDAADSWAQGEDAESVSPTLSSGQGIICDPARIALKTLMSHVPHSHPLSPIKSEDSDMVNTFLEDELSTSRRPDPPAEVSIIPSPGKKEDPEGHDYFLPKDRNVVRQCPRESAVACEIQRFLDSSFEYDPSRVFDSSMDRLNDVSPSKSYVLEERGASRGGASSLPMAPANKANSLFPADNGWVNFESTRESSPRSYRVPARSHN